MDFGDGVGEQPVHLLDEPEAPSAFCGDQRKNRKSYHCYQRVFTVCPGDMLCAGDFFKRRNMTSIPTCWFQLKAFQVDELNWNHKHSNNLLFSPLQGGPIPAIRVATPLIGTTYNPQRLQDVTT